MTTVAWDGKLLAGDRLCCFGGTPVVTTKVFALNGVLIGTAGLKVDGILFREWVEKGRPADKKPVVGDNFTGLLVEASGELIYYDGPKLVPVPMPAGQRWSLGSGCDFALGAMAAGASAIQAVEIACVLDVNTGLGVDYVSL